MKKLTFFLIVIVLGVAGYEYYDRFRPQIKSITEGIKSGTALENLKIEVFTPGGLRAKVESKTSILTTEGVIAATNFQRVDFGKPALKINVKLNQAALAKVKDMFSGQYFEHISPIGLGPADFAKQAGYNFVSVGENLALGNYANDAALVEAWMNSPGHRANILNSKFTEIGVAVLKGTFEGKTTWLAVQEFGKPASDCPSVSELLKLQIDQSSADLSKQEQQIISAKLTLESYPEPKTREEADAYNKKVSEYNALVKIYNNKLDTQKISVEDYNRQVRDFNECIAK